MILFFSPTHPGQRFIYPHPHPRPEGLLMIIPSETDNMREEFFQMEGIKELLDEYRTARDIFLRKKRTKDAVKWAIQTNGVTDDNLTEKRLEVVDKESDEAEIEALNLKAEIVSHLRDYFIDRMRRDRVLQHAADKRVLDDFSYLSEFIFNDWDIIGDSNGGGVAY